MALVFIVYVPDAAKMGPDLTRMNKVEEIPDDLARAMVNDGSARKPTADEVAEFEERRALEAKADSEDLAAMKKDELLALLPDDKQAELPPRATKADIAKAVEEHRTATGTEGSDADVNPDSAATGNTPRPVQPPVVTDSAGNSDYGVEPTD